jgi:hypothetical protein
LIVTNPCDEELLLETVVWLPTVLENTMVLAGKADQLAVAPIGNCGIENTVGEQNSSVPKILSGISESIVVTKELIGSSQSFNLVSEVPPPFHDLSNLP